MGDPVANYTSRLQEQEKEIKLLQDEIERLRDPQEMNFTSSQLDELREENSRLKYRLNILKRLSVFLTGYGCILLIHEGKFLIFQRGQSEVRSAHQQHEDDYISQKSLSSRLSWSALGRTHRLRVMECKVKLLDGTDYTCTVEVGDDDDDDDEGQFNEGRHIIMLTVNGLS
ncbi:arginine--tRNA cytoplasmic [Labeo rohita]|uniref:Arginine--tRNA cytoplasmic n=1 Tax=Labeo rohita TaxID=84645 RepID=A0A498N629_LABRO|nr:arginine--tRNA cytoplasmic [Labeo rohita]